jgi:hypothetical protein
MKLIVSMRKMRFVDAVPLGEAEGGEAGAVIRSGSDVFFRGGKPKFYQQKSSRAAFAKPFRQNIRRGSPPIG